MNVRLFPLSLAIAAGIAGPAASGEGEVPDGRWVTGFHFTGAPGGGSALETFTDGLYLGGEFTRVGSSNAPHIARYDGTQWHAVGEGLDRRVLDLLEYQGLLVAAGRFQVQGETTLVAAWDGVEWSSWHLPRYLLEEIIRLAEHEGEVYAGGWFSRIVRYDGVSWHWVGGQFTSNGAPVGALTAMTSHGGVLYVGGWFDAAGGVPVQRIARWNGTAWEGLGGGPDNGRVRRLMSYDGDLLVMGDFTTTNGEETGGIVRWTGSSWETVGNAPEFRLFDTWRSFVFQNELYLSGLFGLGESFSTILKLVGDEWQFFGGRPNGNIYDLEEFDGQLYITGSFQYAGLPDDWRTFNGVAVWADTAWAQVSPGLGLDDRVEAIGHFEGDLVVAGRFRTAGDVHAERVARLTGTGWSAVGPDAWQGSWARVRAMLSAGGLLYVGGDFSIPDVGEHISVWNGSEWGPLGSGMNDDVHALLAYDGEVIAGGEFRTAGGEAVGAVARWSGTEWSPLGAGVWGEERYGAVLALTEYQGELIAGGSFIQPRGGVGNRVAAWNGSVWRPLHAGMDGTVTELVVHAGDLVAGGSFSRAGGLPADRLTRWDGQAWHAYEPGLPFGGSVTALGVFGGHLVVAVPGHVLFRTEGEWVEVGETDGNVDAFLDAPEGLYAVGSFGEAGGIVSYHIALWQPIDPVGSDLLDADRRDEDTVWIRSSPNPFGTASLVSFKTPRSGPVRLGIYDVQGRLVRTLVDSELGRGRHESTWRGVDDAGYSLPAGVYFLRLETDTADRSAKIVRLR